MKKNYGRRSWPKPDQDVNNRLRRLESQVRGLESYVQGEKKIRDLKRKLFQPRFDAGRYLPRRRFDR